MMPWGVTSGELETGRIVSDGNRKQFEWDVFLSHNSKDKPAVRTLASRLKADGFKVWLDEDVIKPGDSIPSKLMTGLESSRVLLMLLSKNFDDSDWAEYESGVFLFKDPKNKQRRFIPVKLDDTPPRDALKHFAWVNWSQQDDGEYQRLAEACRFEELVIEVMQTEAVTSPEDPNREVPSRPPKFPFSMGHTDWVQAVAISDNGTVAVTGCNDAVVRVWDLINNTCKATLEGHTRSVYSVALTPDGQTAISGSIDNTVKVWDLTSNPCNATLQGHTNTVYSVAFTPDGKTAISGSIDHTVKVWDLTNSSCQATLEGHTGPVSSVVLTPDGKMAISGSNGHTVKVWDLTNITCQATLEGHTGEVSSVAFTPEAPFLFASAASNAVLRFWNLDGEQSQQETTVATRIRSAKVLLVGENRVGKTGLAMRLATGEWEATESTDGHWATRLKAEHHDNKWALTLKVAPGTSDDGISHELWLWDFAGQMDYRLVHQMFMDRAALVLLTFDPQSKICSIISAGGITTSKKQPAGTTRSCWWRLAWMLVDCEQAEILLIASSLTVVSTITSKPVPKPTKASRNWLRPWAKPWNGTRSD